MGQRVRGNFDEWGRQIWMVGEWSIQVWIVGEWCRQIWMVEERGRCGRLQVAGYNISALK